MQCLHFIACTLRIFESARSSFVPCPSVDALSVSSRPGLVLVGTGSWLKLELGLSPVGSPEKLMTFVRPQGDDAINGGTVRGIRPMIQRSTRHCQLNGGVIMCHHSALRQVMGVFEGTQLWDRFLSTRAELYRWESPETCPTNATNRVPGSLW